MRPLLLLGLLACSPPSDTPKDSDHTDTEVPSRATFTVTLDPPNPTSADDITATWDGHPGATVT